MNGVKRMMMMAAAVLLSSCNADYAVILGVMAIGAASGLKNSVNDHDKTSATASTAAPVQGNITVHEYDGLSDDLLTAGLGQSGLTGIPPVAVNPASPSAEEIRKATIVNQYHAYQDMRAKSGYGTLYGPAVPSQFALPAHDGKVAGKEYLAYGSDHTAMMVQIPSDFNSSQACIVAAPSPGARGVYGAISTVGEWGLKHHCAVAYTDKGAGNGVHDLNTDTVNRLDGTRGLARDVGAEETHFRAAGTVPLDMAAYNSAYPFRLAYKQAHSQQNPEAHWGRSVLEAIAFAFYVLNLKENVGKQSGVTEKQIVAAAEEDRVTSGNNTVTDKDTVTAAPEPTLTSANTMVIAAGLSTGGGAAVRAAEQDSQGVIDGVVVAAPLMNLRPLDEAVDFTIVQGQQRFPPAVHRKTVFEVLTYYQVYQPCASANIVVTGVGSAGAAGRCAALFNAGLLQRASLSEQIVEAQARLNAYGAVVSSNAIAPIYSAASVYAGMAVAYANAYGRFSVVDNLCGYSYAGVDSQGVPALKTVADLADDFQAGSGIPPTSGTLLLDNQGKGGRGGDFRYSVGAQGQVDEFLKGALCLRRLAVGSLSDTAVETGVEWVGEALASYRRVQAGLAETLARGDLRGKPALIVHGRDDALAPVNFTGRAYYGLNQVVEGGSSRLVYLEVLHAQHIDAFNQESNRDDQVPLVYYFNQALESMYDFLRNGTPLPQSQVVATVPLTVTGGSVTPQEHVPSIRGEVVCPIRFGGGVLEVPEC